MQKTSRTSSRSKRSSDRDDSASPSYYEWRERAAPVVTATRTLSPEQSGSLVRLFRRMTGR